MNLSKYKTNPDLLTYIWCIKFTSAQWLSGILNPDLIIEAAKRSEDFNESKLDLMTKAATSNEVLNPEEVLQKTFLNNINRNLWR